MSVPPSPLQLSTSYHSFLVRLWQDGAAEPWRASAHCVQTGETHRFATVEALFAFLIERLGPPEDGSGQPSDPP